MAYEVPQSLVDSFSAAINGHNVMAVALSQIAQGCPSAAREIATQALTELELDADNVLKVHAEFGPIYAKLRERSPRRRQEQAVPRSRHAVAS